MKRVVLGILMIVSLSFLCGFSPSLPQIDDYIMLSLDFSSNGQIVQSIDFGVNSQFISQNANSLKEELDFKNALVKQVETLRNEFLFSFALAYINNPVEEYKINKGVVLTEVVYNEESDTVGFKIGFESVGAWNYYHSSGTSSSGDKDYSNPFVNKIESVGAFPFSAVVNTGEKMMLVGERYKEKFLNAAKGLSFENKLQEDYSPHFVYNYSTFNYKLRADSHYSYKDSRGHLHHLWIVEEKTLNENNSIKLYYYEIQKGTWLALAIILPLAGMTTAIAIIKIKEKKRKSS